MAYGDLAGFNDLAESRAIKLCMRAHRRVAFFTVAQSKIQVDLNHTRRARLGEVTRMRSKPDGPWRAGAQGRRGHARRLHRLAARSGPGSVLPTSAALIPDSLGRPQIQIGARKRRSRRHGSIWHHRAARDAPCAPSSRPLPDLCPPRQIGAPQTRSAQARGTTRTHPRSLSPLNTA